MPVQETGAVFSLGEEEEEEAGVLAEAGGGATPPGLWAAELALLALHAGIILPQQVRVKKCFCLLPKHNTKAECKYGSCRSCRTGLKR